jgi:hypothetical protein
MQQMKLAGTSTKCNFKRMKFVGLFIVWQIIQEGQSKLSLYHFIVKEQPNSGV